MFTWNKLHYSHVYEVFDGYELKALVWWHEQTYWVQICSRNKEMADVNLGTNLEEAKTIVESMIALEG